MITCLKMSNKVEMQFTESLSKYFYVFFKSKKGINFLILGMWNALLATSVVLVLQKILKDLSPQQYFFISSIVVGIQAHWIMRKFIWFSHNSYGIELI